jgi:hypothetical protein
MHGFPLKFGRIGKQMHKGKMKFATERAAKEFNSGQSVYLCPFCCMYHLSSHKQTPRYAQERWWIIWHKEMGTV